MHLLNLSFGIAAHSSAGDDVALETSIRTKQLTGIAGLAAERIRRALRLPADVEGLARVLSLHPLLNPAGYVEAGIDGAILRVEHSPGHDDGAWITLCSRDSHQPLQAIATAVDPHLRVDIIGTETDWTAEFIRADTALPTPSRSRWPR